jgi:hypothetical protein
VAVANTLPPPHTHGVPGGTLLASKLADSADAPPASGGEVVEPAAAAPDAATEVKEADAKEDIKVYVGNLAWSVTDDALRHHFSNCPGLVSAEVRAAGAGRLITLQAASSLAP